MLGLGMPKAICRGANELERRDIGSATAEICDIALFAALIEPTEQWGSHRLK
ncbi:MULTISPECIES: hypothetical protein [unclassified Acidisoma]|uniref:hypothetical protein n=1 Tax=unclassified Acidisoma TaxID=2634065 RepID=UPI00131BBF27|nr:MULTISPECIES: hypothetical protein [unclassified Acidisoma]